MRRLSPTTIAFVLLAALSLFGCSVDLQEDLEDAERTRAIEMPVNRVVVDFLYPEGGDKRDWKFFTIPSDGLVTITVGFDKEETGPGVEIVNEVGQVLSNLKLPDNTTGLRRLAFEAKPGNYYVHVSIQRGATDYSVEVVYEPGAGLGGGELSQ